MEFSQKLLKLKKDVLQEITPYFERVEEIEEENTFKVLEAFKEAKVSDSHFGISSGYAYDDIGRSKLEEVYSRIFRAESALVRPQFVSGTHALATALFGCLRPGDELISLTGAPYDTMQTVIGHAVKSKGSLKEFGIDYDELPLIDGRVDINGIKNILKLKTKLVLIQRSRGYSMREPLSVSDIEIIVSEVKKYAPNAIAFVDNCYGEFVDPAEPSDYGADMTVGSLIKNPGGGLAPMGGYIAGSRECVENCAVRLTSPGLGREVGASLNTLRSLYQGFFLAPTVTAGALKAAVFAANLYEQLGFKVIPGGAEKRNDIIQAVEFGFPEGVIRFCEGIQAAAPVDSYVTPEPWAMPGYDSEVIMAAGAFIQGSSIELSADGPIKPPYAVYFQGGLTWEHARYGILRSLQSLYENGYVKL